MIRKSSILNLLKDIVIVLGAYFVITTLAFASYHIPSESMVPTLEVGDRLMVNKFTYGYSRYSVPLHPPLFEGRILEGGPKRGDVVVFHEAGEAGGSLGLLGRVWTALNFSDGITYIKRVVGLPGDTIQMVQGRLFINGELVPRTFVGEVTYKDRYGLTARVAEFEEALPGGVTHRIYERTDNGPLDNTRTFKVPPGHYFMMGDNRDNSTDSRAPRGFVYVPAERLIGRADLISYSIARCDQAKGIDCVVGIPFERFFNRLSS